MISPIMQLYLWWLSYKNISRFNSYQLMFSLKYLLLFLLSFSQFHFCMLKHLLFFIFLYCEEFCRIPLSRLRREIGHSLYFLTLYMIKKKLIPAYYIWTLFYNFDGILDSSYNLLGGKQVSDFKLKKGHRKKCDLYILIKSSRNKY